MIRALRSLKSISSMQFMQFVVNALTGYMIYFIVTFLLCLALSYYFFVWFMSRDSENIREDIYVDIYKEKYDIKDPETLEKYIQRVAQMESSLEENKKNILDEIQYKKSVIDHGLEYTPRWDGRVCYDIKIYSTNYYKLGAFAEAKFHYKTYLKQLPECREYFKHNPLEF